MRKRKVSSQNNCNHQMDTPQIFKKIMGIISKYVCVINKKTPFEVSLPLAKKLHLLARKEDFHPLDRQPGGIICYL